MGDRTNIAAALDKSDHCTGGWVCPAVAHFHGCHCDDGNCDRPAEHTAVPLRADPDTSDEWSAQPQPATLVTEQPDGSVTRTQVQRVSLREVYDPDTSDGHKPCPHCNDEGVVCTHDGEIIGPCDCTSDELAAEARQLLDAATPGPWERPSPTANWFTVPQPIQIDEADWGQEAQENGAMCGYRIGTLADERAWRYADVELIAAAPRLIAALLERAVTAEADLRALSTRTTGDSKVDLRMLYAYEAGIMERDAERAARERAETEARQLRELLHDVWLYIDWRYVTKQLTTEQKGMFADAVDEHTDDGYHAADRWWPAVAEGAEDRGQTDD